MSKALGFYRRFKVPINSRANDGCGRKKGYDRRVEIKIKQISCPPKKEFKQGHGGEIRMGLI